MSCDNCGYWHRGIRTTYSNGEVIEALLEKPKCMLLNVETPGDFGCIKFKEVMPWARLEVRTKSGAPWENWYYGPCPGCQGVGNSGSACHRCAGTAKVRYYDDGYIGEEQHRTHPMEHKQKKQNDLEELEAKIRAIRDGMEPEPAVVPVDPTKLSNILHPDVL